MRKVGRPRSSEQLVQVVCNAAELDRERLVVDERVLAPPPGTDRADAEPQRTVEAAEPLLVNVPGGDGVGIHRRNSVGVRLDDVLVRRRRGVAAQHAAGLHGRLEATQELEPVLAELLARPLRGLDHAVVRLLVAEVEGDEDVVGVPVHARAAEILEELDALARLRTALCNVAERDDQVWLALLQVRECSAERDGVPVHVGDEGDAHTGTL